MFRAYSGQFCCSVDETPEGFKWGISNPKTDEVLSEGMLPSKSEAIQAAYTALTEFQRSGVSVVQGL